MMKVWTPKQITGLAVVHVMSLNVFAGCQELHEMLNFGLVYPMVFLPPFPWVMGVLKYALISIPVSHNKFH